MTEEEFELDPKFEKWFTKFCLTGVCIFVMIFLVGVVAATAGFGWQFVQWAWGL